MISKYDATNKEAGEEWVDWITEEGEVIESVPRREMRARNLLHAVTATLVFHPDGRLFVQQRSAGKDVYPGMYDMCVGGTVASGETWEQNAPREVGEELGVKDVNAIPFYFLFAHRFVDTLTNNHIRVFACVCEGPFVLQVEEVQRGEWMTEEQVEPLLEAGLMCPDTSQGWRLYLRRFGQGRNFALEIAPGLKPLGFTP